MAKLTKAQVRDLSGKPEDVSRSLDDSRAWLSFDCAQCGTTAVVEAPAAELNEESYVGDAQATLADGRTVTVAGVPLSRPAATLRFTCNSCGTTQEATL